MAHTIEVSFNVSGICTQVIELSRDCELDGEEIVNGLNGARDTNGKRERTLCTTVQEGGELIQLFPDGTSRVLGGIVSSDMDAEYEEFECKGD